MSKETTVNIAVLGIPSYLLLKEQYAEDGGAAKPLSGGGPGSATPVPVDTSEWNKLGVGKSSLCARFMLPRLDDYQRLSAQLCSSVTRGQFESQAISCDHFIYYGSTTRRYNINSELHSDGEQTFHNTVRFHVVEQTTFIDPRTAAGCNAPLPFPGCSRYIESALKQVLTTNGQGGKLSCVSRPNQQQLHQNHDQHCSRTVANGRPAMSPRPGLDVQYPQGGEAFPESFHVDGFVLVLDMSRSEKDMELQQDLLASVVSQLRKQSQPKPAVLVVTKSETLSEDRQKAVKAYWKAISPGRQKTPLFFCSAEQGVVEAPFLHLSTLVIWESMAVKASRRRHPPLTLYRQHELQWTEQLRVAVLEVTPLVQRHAAAAVDWSTVPLPKLELQEGGRALSTVLGMVGESNCRSILQTIADQLRKARQVGRETRVTAGPSTLIRQRVIRKDQTVAKRLRSKSLTGHTLNGVNPLPSHPQSATVGTSVVVEALDTCSDVDTGRARWATLTPDGACGRHHQKPRISRHRFLPRDQPGCDPGEIAGGMSGEERDNEATDDDSDKRMAPARHRETAKANNVETQQLPGQEHGYISILDREGDGDSQQQGVAMGKNDSWSLSESEQSSSDVEFASDSSSADDGYEKLNPPCPNDAGAHGVKRALRHVMSHIEETWSDETDSDDEDGGNVSRWREDSSDAVARPGCRESSDLDSLEDEEGACRSDEADYVHDWEIHSYLPPALPKRRTGSGRSMAPAVPPDCMPRREQSKLVTGSSGRRKERDRDRAKKPPQRHFMTIPLRPHTTLPPRMHVPDLGTSAPASAGVRGERNSGGAESRGLEELRLSAEQQWSASVDSGITSLLGEDDDERRSTTLSVSTSSASNCSDPRCIAQLSRSATDDHAASNPDDLDHDYILLDSVILPPVRTEQDQGESTVSGAPSASFSSRRVFCTSASQSPLASEPLQHFRPRAHTSPTVVLKFSRGGSTKICKISERASLPSHCDNGSAAETVLLAEQRAGDVVTTTPVEDTTIRHPLASLQSASASSNQNLCNGGNETSPAVWYVPLECASPPSLPPSPDPVMVKLRRVCSKPSEESDDNAPSPTVLPDRTWPHSSPLQVALDPLIKPKVKPRRVCSKPSEESDNNAPSPTVLPDRTRPHSSPLQVALDPLIKPKVKPRRVCSKPSEESDNNAPSPTVLPDRTRPHSTPLQVAPDPLIKPKVKPRRICSKPSEESYGTAPSTTVLLGHARPHSTPLQIAADPPIKPKVKRRRVCSKPSEESDDNAPSPTVLLGHARPHSSPLRVAPDQLYDSPLFLHQSVESKPAISPLKLQHDETNPIYQCALSTSSSTSSSRSGPQCTSQLSRDTDSSLRKNENIAEPLQADRHCLPDLTEPVLPQDETSRPKSLQPALPPRNRPPCLNSARRASSPCSCKTLTTHGAPSSTLPSSPVIRRRTAGMSEVVSQSCEQLTGNEFARPALGADVSPYITVPLRYPLLNSATMPAHGQRTQSPASSRPRKWPSFDMSELPSSLPSSPVMRRRQAEKSDIVSQSHEDLTGNAPVHPALRDVASACSTRSLRYPLLKSAAVPDAFGDAMSASGRPLMTSANSCQVMTSANSSPLMARQQEMESPATNEPKKQPSYDTSEPGKQHGRRSKPLLGSSPPHVDQCAGNDAPDVRPLSGPQHSEDDRSAYCTVPTGPSSPAPDTSDPRQTNSLARDICEPPSPHLRVRKILHLNRPGSPTPTPSATQTPLYARLLLQPQSMDDRELASPLGTPLMYLSPIRTTSSSLPSSPVTFSREVRTDRVVTPATANMHRTEPVAPPLSPMSPTDTLRHRGKRVAPAPLRLALSSQSGCESNGGASTGPTPTPASPLSLPNSPVLNRRRKPKLKKWKAKSQASDEVDDASPWPRSPSVTSPVLSAASYSPLYASPVLVRQHRLQSTLTNPLTGELCDDLDDFLKQTSSFNVNSRLYGGSMPILDQW